MTQQVDVAIFGAGIAGASLAWRLAAHRSVALIERESQAGYHSTGRSAAMFMESYGPPMVRALTRASRPFYVQPPAGFTATPIVSPRGALYLASPGQQAQLDETRAELAPTCPNLQSLNAAQTLALVPCLRPDNVLASLLDPDAMDLDVHALHQGFLRGFRQRGQANGCALTTDATLTQARHDGQRWHLQFADGVALQATTSAFTFKCPEGLDAAAWPVVSDLAETYYFKPDAGQFLGSPANADATHPHDVVPEELDIAKGIHAIEEATTLQIRRPTSTWAGLRSFVPDGEIVIGFDDGVPGLFWLAAQGGYGIQSAAGASALADALIRGVPLPEELQREGLRPEVVSPRRLR
jgi:D-arginine dehydrogenase